MLIIKFIIQSNISHNYFIALTQLVTENTKKLFRKVRI